jgi:GNAT superfamily N-acetyltransferase
MNFYSDDIIKEIRNADDPIPKIEELYTNIARLFYTFSHHVVSPTYVLPLLLDRSNKIAFRCIDMEFNVNNSPSMLIYHKTYYKETNELIFYILMICTRPKFKKYGYASQLLDDFIKFIKSEYQEKHEKYANIKIALSSLESAVTFYESYGFRWTRESITAHKTLLEYEKYEEDKEYFMLELIV